MHICGPFLTTTCHPSAFIFENFEFDGNLWWVTCDVESLYTNIKHEHGIEAITYFLNQKGDGEHMLDSFLIDLFNFILRHNYFIFDGMYYRPVSGTAMGVCCAPSCAKLFLGWWEAPCVYPSSRRE